MTERNKFKEGEAMTDLYENNLYNKTVFVLAPAGEKMTIVKARVERYEGGFYMAKPAETSPIQYHFKDEDINKTVFFSAEAAAAATKKPEAEEQCPSCRYMISCNIDKQAFYKNTGKKCDEYKKEGTNNG